MSRAFTGEDKMEKQIVIKRQIVSIEELQSIMTEKLQDISDNKQCVFQKPRYQERDTDGCNWYVYNHTCSGTSIDIQDAYAVIEWARERYNLPA
jgi:hypothetical protein